MGANAKMFSVPRTPILAKLVSYIYGLEGLGQRSSTGLSKQC